MVGGLVHTRFQGFHLSVWMLAHAMHQQAHEHQWLLKLIGALAPF